MMSATRWTNSANLLGLVATILLTSAHAEGRGRIVVFVRDSRDDRPVRSAHVRLAESDSTNARRSRSPTARLLGGRTFSITDAAGCAVIGEIPLGTAALQVFTFDYQAYVDPAIVVSDRVDTLRIALIRQAGFDPDSLPPAWWNASPVMPRITPISEFQSLDDSEIATVRVKFTWGGSERYSLPSEVLLGDSAGTDLALFEQFHRCEDSFYLNDRGSPTSARLATRRMQTLLERLADIPGLRRAEMEPHYALSFSVLALRAGEPIVFECIPADTTRRLLFRALFASTTGDHEASEWARNLGCRFFWPMPDDIPEDVTDLVTLELSGLRRQVGRETYVARTPRTGSIHVTRIRITNRSNRLLPAPLTLAIDGYMGMAFLLGSVRPCHIEERFTIDFPVGEGLRPSESVEATARFDVDDDKMVLKGRVFAGPGVR